MGLPYNVYEQPVANLRKHGGRHSRGAGAQPACA